LREAQIIIESWRRHFNTIRPHASLGYKPPAPEVFVPAFAAWPAALNGTEIRRHAAELVSLAPDVILAHGGSTVGPLLQVTRTVPRLTYSQVGGTNQHRNLNRGRH